jgi:raffinose/stachyose/melibiose transport system substrate-binding protein
MTTPEFAAVFGNALPGFFPLNKQAPALDNAHAAEFLALNEGRGTDVRWAWQGLLSGDPNGYNLMQDNTIAVINGTMDATQAADSLQEGLAKWYEPAKTCKG